MTQPTNADDKSPEYRRQGRQIAMQFLHQLSTQDGANLDQLAGFLAEYGDNDRSRQLAADWITGSWPQFDRIDSAIQSVSVNWDVNRINQVDRSNLRLAVYQLLFCSDIPPKVVINEAVELAKQFSTTQAAAFVNGVLDGILRAMKNGKIAPDSPPAGGQSSDSR